MARARNPYSQRWGYGFRALSLRSGPGMTAESAGAFARVSTLILHRAPLDLEQAVEAGGRHRRLHLHLDVALAEEGIDPALRQALIGLPHRLHHRREGGAGGGGEPEAERGEVALP